MCKLVTSGRFTAWVANVGVLERVLKKKYDRFFFELEADDRIVQVGGSF